MIKHFGISTCDSLPKAPSCTLALEGGGSATFFRLRMEQNVFISYYYAIDEDS